MTVKFTKEEMLEILYDSADVVSNEIVDKTRWAIVHDLIFLKDGKYYRTWYQVGATESQDESAWEYEDTVECTEVEPYEKTVTAYREVK